MQEAKFTPVDSKMIIDRGNTNRASTVGLSKEEVIKFANDPFWVTLRCFLFVLFWIFWVAMLNGAIVIIVFTPKCCKPKELYWYESSPIYTIRVDKFADSNSDGIGDLAGIISKLKYIQDDIFIKAIALEGLLDRNNPTEIKQNLGTLDDFIKLASYIKMCNYERHERANGRRGTYNSLGKCCYNSRRSKSIRHKKYLQSQDSMPIQPNKD